MWSPTWEVPEGRRVGLWEEVTGQHSSWGPEGASRTKQHVTQILMGEQELVGWRGQPVLCGRCWGLEEVSEAGAEGATGRQRDQVVPEAALMRKG